MEILVVDDESNVLDSQRRILASLGARSWNVTFASSGEQALASLESSHVDLIISDLRMPGMDGATLLSTVAQRWPKVARFALSGEANQRFAIRVAGGAVHQFFSKPCPPQTLIDAVRGIERLAGNEEATAISAIVSAVPRLPTLPSVFVALRAALADEKSQATAIGDVVRQDPGIAAKILQLANSAFFFRGGPIVNARAAVARLGISLLSRLVLVEGLLAGGAPTRCYADDVRRFFRASLVAEAAVSGTRRDEASLAVLLCPIGRALLLAADPEGVDLVTSIQASERVALEIAERRVFGTTHAAVGAHLIALWGLPRTVGDAVENQHRVESSDDETRAATLLANRDIRGQVLDPVPALAKAWDRELARLEQR